MDGFDDRSAALAAEVPVAAGEEVGGRPALTLCPTCKSSQPHLHPAPAPCPDLYHWPVPMSLTEWRREAARWAALIDDVVQMPVGSEKANALGKIAAEMRREVRESAAPANEYAAEPAESVCGLCGHEMTVPLCGWAAVGDMQLCHAEDHSCYQRWTVFNDRPAPAVRDGRVSRAERGPDGTWTSTIPTRRTPTRETP